MNDRKKTELLAPAGDTASFLAAAAAGADAVYLGLKNFSARAGAENFRSAQLESMVDLAEKNGFRIYVAFNSLLKNGDIAVAGRILRSLSRNFPPHGLIIQDIGMVELARDAGYEGELHLSTLGNTACMQDVLAASRLGISRVVLPRELSVDEIRAMDAAAPGDMEFEMFIHGALCWCVSGRCYWSSYLGGKSGLRGRCVQPCRRIYTQRGREERYFSCLDLSLDALVKIPAELPHVRSLKIEGRKKGPHYVYHAVSAYRMLLDALGTDDWPQAKRNAEQLLEMALGRPSTHARFLPQKNNFVSAPGEPTSSGLLVGKIQFSKEGESPFIKPRVELLPKDLLRIGFEDDPWHDTLPVVRRTPKAGTYVLKTARSRRPKPGVPVFLIDRREPGLQHVLHEWEQKLAACASVHSEPEAMPEWSPRLPRPCAPQKLPDQIVRPTVPVGRETRASHAFILGLWMSANTLRAVSRTTMQRICWWLPPVIWPEENELWKKLVAEALRGGSQYFVLNSPWQAAFFPPAEKRAGVRLIAGPFCNMANIAALQVLKKMGFDAAFASPELSSGDYLSLPAHSPLPLGMVLSGYWPVGISRFELNQAKPNIPFFSPKGECFWARRYGRNLWIYPSWPMDISAHKRELEAAGYTFFARLDETPPQGMPPLRRTSTFNWDGALL